MLDRILLFNYYVIPQFHIGHYRVAYWNKLSRPAISPKYNLGFDFWWYDYDKESKLSNLTNNEVDKNNSNNKYFYIIMVLVSVLIIWKIRRKV